MNYKNLTKEALPKEFQERIERFNRLFSEAGDGTFEGMNCSVMRWLV